MEELDKISVIVGIQEVNNFVNYVNDLYILASNKNIVIKEIDYSLKTLYKSRKEHDLLNGIFHTDLTQEDLTNTPTEIKLFGINVNLKYQS